MSCNGEIGAKSHRLSSNGGCSYRPSKPKPRNPWKCPAVRPTRSAAKDSRESLQGAAASSTRDATSASHFRDMPLSVYPFRQNQKDALFTDAVRKLMNHLSTSRSTSAFVLTSGQAGVLPVYDVHPISPRDGRSWELFSGGRNNLALYVEPIDSPSEFCGSQVAKGSACQEDACQRCPITSVPLLEGCVPIDGDCCGDKEGAATEARSSKAEIPDDTHDDQLDVRYYGCLAQGCWQEGCYLIKTTKQRHGDCQCVHYCVVPMCAGKGWGDQLDQFWREKGSTVDI